MKTVQKYFVFGMLMTAGLIFAGCGDTTTGGGDGSTSTEAPAEGTESSDGSGSAPDNASTGASGELQLVSLSVPNMT